MQRFSTPSPRTTREKMATPTDDPRALLERLRVALQGGLPVPLDVAEWVLRGIDAFERNAGRRSLCSCLKLRAPGRVSIQTAKRREARDAALADAYRGILLLSDGRQPAIQLAERIERFERRRSALAGVLEHPPGNWDRIDKALFRAFRVGVKVPRTPQHLEALAKNRKKQ